MNLNKGTQVLPTVHPLAGSHCVFACVFVLALWAPCPGRWQIRWWQTFSNRVPCSPPTIVFLSHLCGASLDAFVFRTSHVFPKNRISSLGSVKRCRLTRDTSRMSSVRFKPRLRSELWNRSAMLIFSSRLSVNVGFFFWCCGSNSFEALSNTEPRQKATELHE